MTASAEPDSRVTTVVCRLTDIEVEGGVAALVVGEAVAVFRTYDDHVFALSNYDPCSRASVLARGIVGTRDVDGTQVPFVASPMHKQAFDLRTGQCLDDAAVQVPTYDVRVGDDGMVLVGGRTSSS
ncbi:nitrite reductase small subunit [Nocardioides szechwanensis]|uniref:Assimilatory nitrite reductase (NAD(P)H) small subunit n=1 Tax=Nocardioides szechwanensis TaxID=1005944 RepID=A0A1H0CG93_9ACTN|nr:nitrite reductase small subunit NirD [Nocardioides szechwanensis]GEP33437.1 nitrite reductase small subunit [Nocardioides szechwanensis]SDN56876.1 assimilatory nitrite reductase (NAD(P)H) small subunit [Nocardioides szechwanensis]